MADASVRVRSVVLDCPDPPALATFYGQLLDAPVNTSDPEQIHLDLDVTDLDAASARAVALGARVLTSPVPDDNCTFVVHADPAGHPFCLCRWDP
jgi:predicted enzyme related to lactoylglutathione lyase